eukprot:Gregarina_sp_Poly_1__10147@NODE_694_length_6726_cov_13_942184_g524_i0_p1_GENE_NODE_694_length_6726_cov_13_942184_g524_i0NODE_694_length_6726_cov_13_942184_g524_i0_p1_ORF_typecomplete_len398_score28_99AAAATPase_like/PF09820_9/2_6e67AAA_35/PF14516_6/0_056AAA_35/PF14516_6/5e03AAA_22/PF13401_6/0_027_NODE_694_length_6726_cov_13_942184_g524_i020833276
MAKVPIGNMEEIKRRYPIGIDKTQLIYQLVTSLNFCFLTRPHRFGKSLLLSTLKAFFEGKKELFKGLIIETLEKDWTRHPILHMDFGETYYETRDELKHVLDEYLSIWEDTWPKRDNQLSQKPVEKEYASIRLKRIIQSAHRQTGKRVVILIDGYDKPLLNAWNNSSHYDGILAELCRLFSTFKSYGSHIRFLFITGVFKFSQTRLSRPGIFDDFNHVKDISLCKDFNSICGFTEEELETNLRLEIDQLASASGETFAQSFDRLKAQYDGYHFSPNSANIFNPCSIFDAFYGKEYDRIWFSAGTQIFLMELLQKLPKNLLDNNLTIKDFDAPMHLTIDPFRMLFQSGYLTIKEFLPERRECRLAVPNEEVRTQLLNLLVGRYIRPPTSESTCWRFGQ